jgi:hypothetical protein
LLLAFRRSMAQPGQPSTAGGGSNSGASSLPISIGHLASYKATPPQQARMQLRKLCSSICASTTRVGGGNAAAEDVFHEPFDL